MIYKDTHNGAKQANKEDHNPLHVYHGNTRQAYTGWSITQWGQAEVHWGSQVVQERTGPRPRQYVFKIKYLLLELKTFSNLVLIT